MRVKVVFFIFFYFLFVTCISHAKMKDDFGIDIDNSGLKYICTKEGFILNNTSQFKLTNLEFQTYPTESSAISRMLGQGSFYYQLPSLDSYTTIHINWNKFSNKDGQYLNIGNYAFNRVSIYADKIINEKDKKHFGEHVSVIKENPIKGYGFEIKLKNSCRHPIDLAIKYINHLGAWDTKYWYHFKPNEESYLSSSGQKILTQDSIIYYYAKTTDNSNITWEAERSADNIIHINLFEQRYGRQWQDSVGETTLTLTCEGL